ncbi:Mitochondrial import inner membrane translocase subunit TIM22-4 [Glycine max]|nr:Mitochondrial import inner membrane translocase subunit TIM22-4 [Glycine max]
MADDSSKMLPVEMNIVKSGGLGIFMGLFLGALDKPLMQEEMTGRQQLIYQAKQMGRRRWSLAKAFAVMGCIFSAAECVVEKALAKHDMTNTVSKSIHRLSRHV